MGTNKSKIIDKIKLMVQDKPITEVKEKFPEITSNIKGNFISDEISEDNFVYILGVVSAKLEELLKEDDTPLEEDITEELVRDRWVELVLESIEGADMKLSKLLERALKLALVATVDATSDVKDFVFNLFYNLTKLGLEDSLQGALSLVADGLSIQEINKQFIIPITDNIFSGNIQTKVDLVIKGELSIAKMSDYVMGEVSKFEFGAF